MRRAGGRRSRATTATCGVSSEDGEIRIEIEFQDGRSRRTDLTWENARRFAYGILEETDKAIAPEVDAE